MDTVDVDRLGKSLGSSVTPLTWVDVNGLSMLIDCVSKGEVFNLLNWTERGRCTGGVRGTGY